ncbi:hypothetical protein NMF47_07505, partial [Serratia nevei]|uniref:hypothetical protein n=1 Tax=Serratia nevei TaxID=2703794 RepID=UPI0027E5195B
SIRNATSRVLTILSNEDYTSDDLKASKDNLSMIVELEFKNMSDYLYGIDMLYIDYIEGVIKFSALLDDKAIEHHLNNLKSIGLNIRQTSKSEDGTLSIMIDEPLDIELEKRIKYWYRENEAN